MRYRWKIVEVTFGSFPHCYGISLYSLSSSFLLFPPLSSSFLLFPPLLHIHHTGTLTHSFTLSRSLAHTHIHECNCRIALPLRIMRVHYPVLWRTVVGWANEVLPHPPLGQTFVFCHSSSTRWKQALETPLQLRKEVWVFEETNYFDSLVSLGSCRVVHWRNKERFNGQHCNERSLQMEFVSFVFYSWMAFIPSPPVLFRCRCGILLSN